MGRSGHGKSSLINALAGRKVAEVDDIKPRTIGADPHYISFPEFYAEWEIIDSRGIFETTSPEGAPQQDALTQVKEDIRRHRPDVVLHVIAAPETRTLQNDFKAFAE
ncbi:MAG: GTPase, partial [Rubrobacter sp.]